MWYKKSRSVPADTAIASPDKQTMPISKGTLKGWLFVNPAECADLMKFKIFYHGVQLFPFTRDEWADALIDPEPLPESIEIDVPPYVLNLEAYNLDDAFDHEYNIYANVIPKKPAQPLGPTENILDRFRNLFGGGG